MPLLYVCLWMWLSACACVRACGQASLSRSFCKDTWLEAVNLLQPAEINVARITQVKGRLLWLRYEGKRLLCVGVYDTESASISLLGVNCLGHFYNNKVK